MSLRSALAILTAGLWLSGGVSLTGCSASNPLYERRVGATDDSATIWTGFDAGTALPDATTNAPEVGEGLLGNDAGQPPMDPVRDVPLGDAGSPITQAPDVGPTVTDAMNTVTTTDGVSSANPDGQGDAGPLADGGTTPAPPPATRLVGYWRFNEASGVIAADASDNHLSGTLENFPANGNWVATPSGGGLRFLGGSLSVGVRVGAPNAVPTPIRDLRRFTVAAWIYRDPASVARHVSVMSWQSANLDDKDVFNLAVDGTRLLLYVSDRANESVIAQASLSPGGGGGAWVHVAGSFDGENLRVYLNGVQAGAPVAYARPLVASPYPLYIGTNKNPKSADQPFEGVLDEVLLYSEALDDDTIAKIRNGNIPLR